MGVAEFDHAGTLGIFDHAAFQRHGAQFVRRTAAWPHGKSSEKFSKKRIRSGLAVLLGAGSHSGKALNYPLSTNARL
jgi:hypothetical protein